MAALDKMAKEGVVLEDEKSPRWAAELSEDQVKGVERERERRTFTEVPIPHGPEYEDDLDDHATKNKRLKRKFKMIRAILDEEGD